MSEDFVAALWERQLFSSDVFSDLGIRVVFRGLPSDAGGPDYQDALLEVGGRTLIRGDVEFHTNSSSWYAHGHHRDRRYNGVILHVVWEHDGRPTELESGAHIPVVALAPYVQPNTIEAMRPQQSRLLLFPCTRAVASLTDAELHDRLAGAGLQRFCERTDRFVTDLTAMHPDQVAYAAMMEALGYASNRDTFRQLADCVPYHWLMTIPASDRTEVILHAAGFALTSTQTPLSRVSPSAWRLARIRPGNHPAQRLRGFVQLLNDLGQPLADSIARIVRSADRASTLRNRLMDSNSPTHLIGKGRADEIACSVVLPFVAAYCPESPSPTTLFARYPSPPPNRWTRAMLKLFEEAGHGNFRISRASEHQGMHHVYHTFCRRQSHTSCPLCNAGGTR